jgi:hypothetical protein
MVVALDKPGGGFSAGECRSAEVAIVGMGGKEIDRAEQTH